MRASCVLLVAASGRSSALSVVPFVVPGARSARSCNVQLAISPSEEFVAQQAERLERRRQLAEAEAGADGDVDEAVDDDDDTSERTWLGQRVDEQEAARKAWMSKLESASWRAKGETSSPSPSADSTPSESVPLSEQAAADGTGLLTAEEEALPPEQRQAAMYARLMAKSSEGNGAMSDTPAIRKPSRSVDAAEEAAFAAMEALLAEDLERSLEEIEAELAADLRSALAA
jgi:hypothetical protein